MDNSYTNTLEKILSGEFKIIEVIDYNAERCYMTLLGNFMNNGKEEIFVLKMKKKEYTPYGENELNEVNTKLKLLIGKSEQSFNNDIYYKFLSEEVLDNKIKLDLVYPVDHKVIDKYRKRKFILFNETYEIYKEKTLKFIESIDPNHTKWIQNALYNNAEKILFKNDHFIILQDYNSVGSTTVLNCLALPFKEGIMSVRDLKSIHLDLLKSLYEDGVK